MLSSGEKVRMNAEVGCVCVCVCARACVLVSVCLFLLFSAGVGTARYASDKLVMLHELYSYSNFLVSLI